MSLIEDPLKQVYYFRVIDWFQSKVWLSRLVLGFIFLYITSMFSLGLYHVRDDSEKVFFNLMIAMTIWPCIMVIPVYLVLSGDIIEITKKANKKFKPLQSEGPEVFEKITYLSKNVATWLWIYFAFGLLLVIGIDTIDSRKEVQTKMALTNVMVVLLLLFLMNVFSNQARGTNCLWAQMVLLESSISRNLGKRINRDDKQEQERCRKHLRDVAIFHAELKSLANDYFQMLRLNSIVMFFPGSCTFATSLLVFFTDEDKGTKIMMGFVGIYALLNVYIAVMNMQSIIDESVQITDVLYDSPWYNWDKRNCTTLVIIMAAMKDPVMKTELFGIIEVNYRMFLKMFRVSYSVVTLLLNWK